MMDSIRENGIIIKLFSNKIFVFFLLYFIISIISFSLGRLSALDEVSVKPRLCLSANSINSKVYSKNDYFILKGGFVLASRFGKKYYAPWCMPSVLNPSNVIWFKSIKEARAQGLEPSKKCKGLN